MRVAVGDDNGLVKGTDSFNPFLLVINVEKSSIINVYGTQESNQEVLAFSQTLQNVPTLLTWMKKNGEVETVDFEKKLTVSKINLEAPTSEYIGMYTIGDFSLDTCTLIYCTKNGELVWHNLLSPKENSGQIKCKGEHCTRIKQSPLSRYQFLIASKETALQLWDINYSKNVWNAKRLPNDYLDLMVKIWDTDCTFHRYNDDIIFTCTGYSHIDQYDRRVKNRPIVHKPFGDIFMNRIDMSCCTNYIFVSDQIGTVAQLDYRKDLKVVKRFKGTSGSLKDLQCHPTKPLFGECGLNRYFKAFNYAENKQVCSVYLKQIQNCFTFLPEAEGEDKKRTVKAKIKQSRKTARRLLAFKHK